MKSEGRGHELGLCFCLINRSIVVKMPGPFPGDFTSKATSSLS